MIVAAWEHLRENSVTALTPGAYRAALRDKPREEDAGGIQRMMQPVLSH
jgi:hypothetical protein